MLHDIIGGLVGMLDPLTILMMILGTLIGIVIGALPGIGASLGIALAIPFTYGMGPLPALALLAGIHTGNGQGAAIPAILFKIPGSAGSMVTSWDGYPLALKGKAGGAINLSAVSCAVGGILSAISLMLLTQPLVAISRSFGPPEIFWVNVFGLATVAALLGNDIIKGLLSACLGLLIGSVGIDTVTGAERYTFDSVYLINGLPDVAVMVGIFTLPPAWELVTRDRDAVGNAALGIKIVSERIWRFAQVWKVWALSSLIGIINGILPGSAIASFLAYSEAKRISKHPEEFGKGSIEGVAASECVGSADNASAMIPTLALGIPGSNVAVLMLSALQIHGMTPGPQLFSDHGTIVYGYAWAMVITSLLLIPLAGAGAARIFAYLLKVPIILLLPLIIVTSVAGTFAWQNSMSNVFIMLASGVVGLAMIRYDFPIAPVVIGLVLGTKAEFNLRVSLLLSDGDWSIFVSRPISIVIMLMTLALLMYPIYRALADRRANRVSQAQAEAELD